MRSSYLEFWISRSTRGTLDYAPDFGRRSAPSDKTLAVGAQVLGRGQYHSQQSKNVMRCRMRTPSPTMRVWSDRDHF